MKIIAGSFKGRKLASISNIRTRPTSARVKESIFNILSHEVKRVNILDLFAGTGALGIEALSRGAKTAVFIDWSRKLVKNITFNLRDLGLASGADVIRWNILKNLNCLTNLSTQFGIVFIDPPYNKNMIRLVLFNLIAINVLKPKACIVVEHGIEEVIPEDLPGLVMVDQRIYGRTNVSFLLSVMR